MYVVQGVAIDEARTYDPTGAAIVARHDATDDLTYVVVRDRDDHAGDVMRVQVACPTCPGCGCWICPM